ncbi:MAG: NrfD/PsrC family molybdoenzyme membrane anchor subunit [Planctomycetota bacterium]
MSHARRSFPTVRVAVLGGLTVLGLGVAIARYAGGIGAVSNLSDGRAWGLWVSLDLFCGVALAAGGFTMAAAVHILNLKKYEPIVRPAVLTAFLGYLMVILALLVDLGQPWRIWHVLIHWNLHSPLFEVAWCVVLYTVVLALEFSPAVFERLRLGRPLRVIRFIQIPLVATGIVLSVMHQSTLGSTLLLMPDAIHPLWFTPVLPLLFLLSAVAVGIAMVIVESALAGHRVDPGILAGLGRALAGFLGLYLAVRLGDLLLGAGLGPVFSSGGYSVLFLVEIVGGVIVPFVLLLRPAVRRSRRALFWCALLAVAGVVLNRFNATLVALQPRPGTVYFPHPLEFAVSIGIVATGVLGYLLAGRYLPVVAGRTSEAG